MTNKAGITGKGRAMLGIDNMIDSVEECSIDTLDHIEDVVGGLTLSLSDKSLDQKGREDLTKDYQDLLDKFKKNCICSKR